MKALSATERAVLRGGTMFPKTVTSMDKGIRVIKPSGIEKLGTVVTTGPWTGSLIYTLTLEERRTCPDTCFFKTSTRHPCYGNNMPMAQRFEHGQELIDRLETELAYWQAETEKRNAKRINRGKLPTYFVVRLHILGDFFSTAYVLSWNEWLEKFPLLRIWGYTHHHPGTEIGDAILAVRESWGGLDARKGGRFCIRFSDLEDVSMGSAPAAHMPEVTELLHSKRAIVCPEQSGKAENCGSCGLCWTSKKAIVFKLH